MSTAARLAQTMGVGDTIDPYAGCDRISIPRARRHWLVSGGLAWLDPWPQQGWPLFWAKDHGDDHA